MNGQMLQFPENYFQEETRCGFTVSKTMKHAWAAQMEVLQRIINICEKYGLTYYAFWGTLLGVVRHEGFIPWDDDLDIAFKREDYQRFLQVAGKELPEEYLIINVHTEEEWPHFCARVTNGRTLDISESRLTQFHGCPFAVGVDIFPLDYIPRDKEAAELQKTLLAIIRDVLPLLKYVMKEEDNAEVDLEEARQTVESGIAKLEEYCRISIERGGNIRSQLLKLYDRLCMIYGSNDGDVLTSYPEYIKGNGFFMPKEWFGTEKMKFENMTLTVPTGYKQVLTALYGDYMTPVRGNQDHDYPFYGAQLRTLHERGLWLDVQE